MASALAGMVAKEAAKAAGAWAAEELAISVFQYQDETQAKLENISNQLNEIQRTLDNLQRSMRQGFIDLKKDTVAVFNNEIENRWKTYYMALTTLNNTLKNPDKNPEVQAANIKNAHDTLFDEGKFVRDETYKSCSNLNLLFSGQGSGSLLAMTITQGFTYGGQELISYYATMKLYMLDTVATLVKGICLMRFALADGKARYARNDSKTFSTGTLEKSIEEVEGYFEKMENVFIEAFGRSLYEVATRVVGNPGCFVPVHISSLEPSHTGKELKQTTSNFGIEVDDSANMWVLRCETIGAQVDPNGIHTFRLLDAKALRLTGTSYQTKDETYPYGQWVSGNDAGFDQYHGKLRPAWGNDQNERPHWRLQLVSKNVIRIQYADENMFHPNNNRFMYVEGGGYTAEHSTIKKYPIHFTDQAGWASTQFSISLRSNHASQPSEIPPFTPDSGWFVNGMKVLCSNGKPNSYFELSSSDGIPRMIYDGKVVWQATCRKPRSAATRLGYHGKDNVVGSLVLVEADGSDVIWEVPIPSGSSNDISLAANFRNYEDGGDMHLWDSGKQKLLWRSFPGDGYFTPVYKGTCRGIAGFEMSNPNDRAFAYDWDSSGKLDHIALYTPGSSQFWVVGRKDGNWQVKYRSSIGIGRYDLKQKHDRALAFDYDSSGKMDHIVTYRRGESILYIHKRIGNTFMTVYITENRIGNYDLTSRTTRIFAFDYNQNGKRDHLCLYAPGYKIFYIVCRKGNEWDTVLASYSGLASFDMGSEHHRAFAHDWTGNGKADHIVLYGPGGGTFYCVERTPNGFNTIYQSDVGIGPFDLRDPSDKMISCDWSKAGKTDSLIAYRPSNGLWAGLRTGSQGFKALKYPNDHLLHRGIGGYDLVGGTDRVFALDYESCGSQNYLVAYRANTIGTGPGHLWVLAPLTGRDG